MDPFSKRIVVLVTLNFQKVFFQNIQNQKHAQFHSRSKTSCKKIEKHYILQETDNCTKTQCEHCFKMSKLETFRTSKNKRINILKSNTKETHQNKNYAKFVTRMLKYPILDILWDAQTNQTQNQNQSQNPKVRRQMKLKKLLILKMKYYISNTDCPFALPQDRAQFSIMKANSLALEFTITGILISPKEISNKIDVITKLK